MKQLTPADRFRREEIKQNARPYATVGAVILIVAMAIAFLNPLTHKQEAEWAALPVQTAIAHVERIQAPEPDENPSTLTTLRMVWGTPSGTLSGEAHTDGVAALG